MNLIKAIGSVIGSLVLIAVLLAIGGLMTLIGYFAGAILLGVLVVGGIACAIYECFEKK